MKIKKKILIAKELSQQNIIKINKKLGKYYQILTPNHYNREEIIKNAKDISICIGTHLESYVIDYAPNLLIFQNIGSGIEEFDLNKIMKKKILLTNSHENSIYVAEYAVTVALSMSKNMNYYYSMLKEKNYLKYSNNNMHKIPTSLVTNKTIGIIGYGCIGKKIKNMLSGFNNKFYVMSNNSKISNSINLYRKSLSQILSKSDIVFINVPLTKKTINMINLDNYKKISNNCILINTSRAEVISYDVFELILKDKKSISYDTFYKHKISDDNLKSKLLKKYSNLIITPYIASIDEDKSFPMKDIILNLISYNKTNKLRNFINFKEGY